MIFVAIFWRGWVIFSAEHSFRSGTFHNKKTQPLLEFEVLKIIWKTTGPCTMFGWLDYQSQSPRNAVYVMYVKQTLHTALIQNRIKVFKNLNTWKGHISIVMLIFLSFRTYSKTIHCIVVSISMFSWSFRSLNIWKNYIFP